jgi:hypothetical protein
VSDSDTPTAPAEVASERSRGGCDKEGSFVRESPTGSESAVEDWAGRPAEGPAEAGVSPGSRRGRVLRHVVVGLVVFAVVASALAGAAALYLGRQFSGTPDPSARSRGLDAIWLGHAWVDGRKTEATGACGSPRRDPLMAR